MKIGILIDRLNVGGVEKVAIEEVRALNALGVNAYLVILSREAVVKNVFPDLLAQIPIIYLEDRLPKFLKSNRKIPFFYFFSLFHITYPFFLPFTIKKNEFTVIVSHNTYTSFTALTLYWFRGIPYLIYIWDPITYILKKVYQNGPLRYILFLLNPIAGFIDQILIRNSKTILVAGSLHAKFLNSIADGKNLQFLPPGHEVIKNLPVKRGKDVMTATAWKEGKGLEILLVLIKEIPNVKVNVVGKWIHETYLQKIKSLIKELKITNRVKIIGEVSEDKLNDAYRKALVTVIINNERGFGLSAIEAASNGCPFIIPNDSGAARYFKKDKDGFYYKYGDLKVLKNYIQQFIVNERLAYTMGKHAWETVKNRYSWESHAKKLIKLGGKYETK